MRGSFIRLFVVAIGLALTVALTFSTVALAQDTGSVTCNGVTLGDNQTAQVATLHPGDQVTCTFTAQTSNARFMFMVGRGFSPLFGHSSTTTFTAGAPNQFASITVYWSAPGAGSVTATFPYQIANPPPQS
jgi:hypothetical protein